MVTSKKMSLSLLFLLEFISATCKMTKISYAVIYSTEIAPTHSTLKLSGNYSKKCQKIHLKSHLQKIRFLTVELHQWSGSQEGKIDKQEDWWAPHLGSKQTSEIFTSACVIKSNSQSSLIPLFGVTSKQDSMQDRSRKSLTLRIL